MSTKDVPATGRAADLRSVAAAIRAWADKTKEFRAAQTCKKLADWELLGRAPLAPLPSGSVAKRKKATDPKGESTWEASEDGRRITENGRAKAREAEQALDGLKKAARWAAGVVRDKLFLLTSCANTYGCSKLSQNAIDWLKAAIAKEDSVQAFVFYRDAQIKNNDPTLRISMRPVQSPMHRLADEMDGWAAEMEKAEHVGHGTSALPGTISQAVGEPAARNVADAVVQASTKEVPWADDAPEYLPLSKARKLIDDRKSVSTLSKLLTPDGDIRYMRKGRRCKVHVADFLRYFRSRPNDPEYVKIVATFIANEGKGDMRFAWSCQKCGSSVAKTADRCPNHDCAGHRPESFDPKIERVDPPKPRR